MKSPLIAVIVAGMAVVSSTHANTGFTRESIGMATGGPKLMEYCIQDACFTYADNQIGRGSGPCRDYSSEAIIDGRRQTVHGTICRQADGSWKIVCS